MNQKEILQKAKKIITEEVNKAGFNVEEIFLFGSRARGDENIDSDWDFYVVIDKEIDFKTKKKVVGNIQMRLAEEEIFSDILINSKDRFEILASQKSTISSLIKEEGIVL